MAPASLDIVVTMRLKLVPAICSLHTSDRASIKIYPYGEHGEHWAAEQPGSWGSIGQQCGSIVKWQVWRPPYLARLMAPPLLHTSMPPPSPPPSTMAWVLKPCRDTAAAQHTLVEIDASITNGIHHCRGQMGHKESFMTNL